MELKAALQELRKEKKRNFKQSIDLIINLKGFDAKKENISSIIKLPHKFKDKKICAFLTKKSDVVYTITQPEFTKYRDKKELKKLTKSFDFFIAAAKLMPAVATTFGKALGPAGKMPSPQLGVLMLEGESEIKQTISKIEEVVKVRIKEPSIKISIGKESMSDEQLIENIREFYKGITKVLPTKKENIKNAAIKLTMGKPVKIEL